MRNRIAKAFEQIGYVPEEQSAFLCSDTNDCSELHNLIIRIPGQRDDSAVLLDAHYDSVAAGPGAADNGSGVAIALEIARLLHNSPPLNYPVVILIDDAEEQGLLGSQAFLKSSYARNIRWAVNLDARGDRGPSMMYQTSHNNRSLMRFYQRVTRTPVANSLMSSVYELLPSDTDFTNSSAHGIQGFNLAFLGGTAFYHRTGDTIAHLDPRSVQHQGEEAWALVQALATQPPEPLVRGDSVYFDLFGREIVWPQSLSPWLIGVVLVLLLGAALPGRSRLQMTALFRGVACLALSVLAALLLSAALLWVLFPHALAIGPDFPAHPALLIASFAMLGCAVPAAMFSRLISRTQLREYLFSYLVVLTCVSIATHALLPGAVYLVLMPALAGAVALAAASMRGWDKPGSAISAVTVCACAASVLWIPLLRLLYLGEGVLALVVIALAAAATFLLLLPLSPLLKGSLLRLSAGGFALAAVAAAVSAFLPRYSPAAPFPLNLYCMQSQADRPRWVILLPAKYHHLVPLLMRAARFTADPDPQAMLPWTPAGGSLYWAPADVPAVPTPDLRVLKTQSIGDSTCIHARLDGSAELSRIVLRFPPAAIVQSMTINGQAMEDIPHSGWKRFSSTLSSGGMDASFCLARNSPTDIFLTGITDGLPAGGQVLINARGDIASASQDGDATYSFRRFDLAKER